MSLIKLKSGTDIRGTAVGENADLTTEAVRKITASAVGLISRKLNKQPAQLTISVGHDSRISSEDIKNCVISVLTMYGVHVLDCSLSSTPAMFMTTVLAECDAAIQITASHHPYDKNGLKFFTRSGGFESADIEDILKDAEDIELPSDSCTAGTVEKTDFMSRYSLLLRKMITDGVNPPKGTLPLAGFKIAVDAGNGVGGFYANDVLAPLGADVSGSRYLDPDGYFPNHIPNPENKQAMDSISQAVVTSGSDLGVIFDTDVDRAACVGSDGEEINRNRLIALASVIALEGHRGGTIVTDSVTSDGLKEFIEKDLGSHHHRFKRGYKNVINEAIRLNEEGVDCPLAIETSGHAALRENYFLDDGAYLITKIIILCARLRKEGKSLGDLIAGLKEPAEETELRFKINESDFKAYGNRVIDSLGKYAESMDGWTVADDNREGIRISLDRDRGDGWMLLRLSVHDPILPFNAESNSEGGIEKILDGFRPFIMQFTSLDLTPIMK